MDRIRPWYHGDTELPMQEGVNQGDTLYSDTDPVGRKARWTLTGMAGDHTFFSAEILYSLGIVKDPVEAYWAENNLDPKHAPYILTLDWVAFRGLPEPTCRRVSACPNHLAKGLLAFLDRVGVGFPETNKETGREEITQSGVSLRQQVPLVDRAMLEGCVVQPAKLPTVSVALYGLYGPKGAYYWNPPINPLTDPYTLMFKPGSLAPYQKGSGPRPRRRPYT